MEFINLVLQKECSARPHFTKGVITAPLPNCDRCTHTKPYNSFLSAQTEHKAPDRIGDMSSFSTMKRLIVTYTLLLWFTLSKKVNHIHEKNAVDECLHLMNIIWR